MNNAANEVSERAVSTGDTVDLTGDSGNEEANGGASDSDTEQQDENGDPSDDSGVNANRASGRRKRRRLSENAFVFSLMHDTHSTYNECYTISYGCASIKGIFSTFERALSEAKDLWADEIIDFEREYGTIDWLNGGVSRESEDDWDRYYIAKIPLDQLYEDHPTFPTTPSWQAQLDEHERQCRRGSRGGKD